jgi:hypothetical protein
MGMYSSFVNSNVTSIGTAFDKTKNHLHQLNAPHPTRVAGQPFVGRVSALYLKVDTISSATKITARLALDADGDISFMPDTEATLATGITTAGTGCAVFRIEVVFDNPLNVDSMYLMMKTDAGTVRLVQSCISWED